MLKQKNKNLSLEKKLYSIPGVVEYHHNRMIVGKPGRRTSLYIDMRRTLTDYSLRKLLISRLIALMEKKPDYICGIESGGSYFGAAVADRLKIPFCILRKKAKSYGQKGWIVGHLGEGKPSVAVIDDLVGEGRTSHRVAAFFKHMGIRVIFYTLFDFGLADYLSKKLKMRIKSVIKFPDFLKAGEETGYFTSEDIKKIKDEMLDLDSWSKKQKIYK